MRAERNGKIGFGAVFSRCVLVTRSLFLDALEND